MTEEEKKYISSIKKKFPDSFIRTEEHRNDLTLVVKKNDITSIMKFLMESEETAFDFLVDITAVDYLKLGGDERFAVIYHLLSHTYYYRLRVKVWIPEEDTMTVDTMLPLWKTANWMEREVSELFGIKFDGHPDLRKLLLPEDFPGYPLRKDYPVEGQGYRSNFPDLKNA